MVTLDSEVPDMDNALLTVQREQESGRSVAHKVGPAEGKEGDESDGAVLDSVVAVTEASKGVSCNFWPLCARFMTGAGFWQRCQ
jgi:hypothetical protein